jgi:hypothetical protein
MSLSTRLHMSRGQLYFPITLSAIMSYPHNIQGMFIIIKRAMTHFALFGCSLVFLYFQVLLVVYYSRINFLLFFTQSLELTKT